MDELQSHSECVGCSCHTDEPSILYVQMEQMQIQKKTSVNSQFL